MEKENESDKILVYGNMSEETYNEQQKLIYFVSIYEK